MKNAAQKLIVLVQTVKPVKKDAPLDSASFSARK